MAAAPSIASSRASITSYCASPARGTDAATTRSATLVDATSGSACRRGGGGAGRGSRATRGGELAGGGEPAGGAGLTAGAACTTGGAAADGAAAGGEAARTGVSCVFGAAAARLGATWRQDFPSVITIRVASAPGA